MIKKYIKILLIIIFNPFLAASGEKPFTINSPRALAMGNTYISVLSTEDTPYYNPAGFAEKTERLSIIRLGFGFNADALKLFTGTASEIKKYSNKQDLSEVPDELLNEMANFHAKYTLSGPLFLSYKGEGFGIGLYNSSDGELNFSGSTIPNGSFSLNFDIGIITGLGVPIYFDTNKNKTLLIGINLKYVNRVKFNETSVDFFNAGKIVDPFDLHTDFLIGQGIGSDIGLIYKTQKTAIGIVIYDWFGMTFSWKKYSSSFTEIDEDIPDTRVSPRLGAGISFSPEHLFGISKHIFSNTKIALDIRDFLVEENSFFNMLHMGFETELFYILKLRFGINKGYFTCGVSINIKNNLVFDYTYFGEEGELMPGQKLIKYHILSVSFGL